MNRIMDSYRNLSPRIKASFWFVFCNVFSKGIVFVTLPVFSRLLTTSEFGEVSVYTSWVSIVSIISTLTIWGGVFNVSMVKHDSRREEVVSSFQGLALFLTVVVFALSFVLFPYISRFFGLGRRLFIFMFIEIAAQVPFFLWDADQRYKFEYKKIVFVTVVISVLNPILGIIMVMNSRDKVAARIISGLIINVILGIIFFVYNQIRGKVLFDKYLWKFAFLFNIVLVPHYLSMQVLNQSDRIMIKSLCGSGDAGIYSVAYNFASVLLLVTSGINSALTPHIYQSLKNRNEQRLKEQTSAIVVLVACFALFFMVLIPDVFRLILPESYYPALKVIPPVSAGAFFVFLYPLFGSVEFYYEEKYYVTAASLAGAILNVLLNYVFIKMYGFIAAAYTTLFCYVCFAICHYCFMRHVMKKKQNDTEIYDRRIIIMCSAALICSSFALYMLYYNNIIRWMIEAIIVVTAVWKKDSIINIIKCVLGTQKSSEG